MLIYKGAHEERSVDTMSDITASLDQLRKESEALKAKFNKKKSEDVIFQAIHVATLHAKQEEVKALQRELARAELQVKEIEKKERDRVKITQEWLVHASKKIEFQKEECKKLSQKRKELAAGEKEDSPAAGASKRRKCAICFEKIIEDATFLPCGHAQFCLCCCASIEETKKNCPLCQLPVTGVLRLRLT